MSSRLIVPHFSVRDLPVQSPKVRKAAAVLFDQLTDTYRKRYDDALATLSPLPTIPAWVLKGAKEIMADGLAHAEGVIEQAVPAGFRVRFGRYYAEPLSWTIERTDTMNLPKTVQRDYDAAVQDLRDTLTQIDRDLVLADLAGDKQRLKAQVDRLASVAAGQRAPVTPAIGTDGTDGWVTDSHA